MRSYNYHTVAKFVFLNQEIGQKSAALGPKDVYKMSTDALALACRASQAERPRPHSKNIKIERKQKKFETFQTISASKG